MGEFELMRILVIEDERKLAALIRKGLIEQSYSVDIAYDGVDGQLKASENDYDLIVLDIIIPKQDGWVTCKKIREDGISTPILILTALGEIDEKVRGLDSGADDYLTKPFAFAEFLARVRALLRRRQADSEPVLKVNDLILDPAKHTVQRNGKIVNITAKEFALLEYLMRNQGRVMTRTQISEHVWDIDFDRMSNVVDVFIKLLRQKIDKGSSKQLIHTVIGVGYVLKEEHEIK
jgi:two-component system, OmpR family, copper resistance phosphate regulon response regulator CusR